MVQKNYFFWCFGWHKIVYFDLSIQLSFRATIHFLVTKLYCCKNSLCVLVQAKLSILTLVYNSHSDSINMYVGVISSWQCPFFGTKKWQYPFFDTKKWLFCDVLVYTTLTIFGPGTKKNLNSLRYASLRPTAGLRPALAFASLRSARNKKV